MSFNGKEDPPSFWRALGSGFVEDQKFGLKVALAGLIIGALAGGGLGIYLFDTFGLIGVGIGALAGAVIGGIGLWLMYQFA